MSSEMKLIFTAENDIQAEIIIVALKSCQIPACRQEPSNMEIISIDENKRKGGEKIYVAKENETIAMEVLGELGLLD